MSKKAEKIIFGIIWAAFWFTATILLLGRL